MFVRDYTHPRWLLEAAMMGMEGEGAEGREGRGREEKRMKRERGQ